MASICRNLYCYLRTDKGTNGLSGDKYIGAGDACISKDKLRIAGSATNSMCDAASIMWELRNRGVAPCETFTHSARNSS